MLLEDLRGAARGRWLRGGRSAAHRPEPRLSTSASLACLPENRVAVIERRRRRARSCFVRRASRAASVAACSTVTP
eukprot:5170094-Prymnesium_polylepis.1